MSPSESQLRAALSDGEGDGPDADAIIGRALVVKRQRQLRRVRVAGVLGVAAVVGGIGIGLAATQGNDRSTAGSDALAPARAAAGQSSNAAAGTLGSAAEPSAPKGPAPVDGGADYNGSVNAPPLTTRGECPVAPIRYLLAGGGGSTQFGGAAALFDKPVGQLTICGYSPETNAFGSRDIISGDAARALVARLDASTAKASAVDCVTPINLEILAKDASGVALTPLTVVGTCQQATVTNGTAVRYATISALAPYVAATSLATPPPSGMMSGSPVH